MLLLMTSFAHTKSKPLNVVTHKKMRQNTFCLANNWGQEISFATLSCFCKSGYVFPAVHIKTEAHSSLIHNLRCTTGCHWNGRILGKKMLSDFKGRRFCLFEMESKGLSCFWMLPCILPWVVWHFIHILPLLIYIFFFIYIGYLYW